MHNTFFHNRSAGRGKGGTDARKVGIIVSPLPRSIVLDSGVAQHAMQVFDSGVLYTTDITILGPTPDNIKLTNKNAIPAEVGLEVDDVGRLQLNDVPDGGSILDDNIHLRSQTGQIFKLTASEENELQTELVP